MSQQPALGNVGTRLVLENDRVKVWEMQLEPGESSDLHRHTMDYVLCILEGTSIDADRPDGESFRAGVAPGDVFYVERGGVERAVNRSGTRFRELIVELKDGPRGARSTRRPPPPRRA
jgi:quercetin dioxygenase-like cupin family protein